MINNNIKLTVKQLLDYENAIAILYGIIHNKDYNGRNIDKVVAEGIVYAEKAIKEYVENLKLNKPHAPELKMLFNLAQQCIDEGDLLEKVKTQSNELVTS